MATRLTFSYTADEVRLVGRRSLEMRTPPSDDLGPMPESTGFWVELQDSSGRVLYRRITESPIRFSVEVRSDDPERPLERRAVEEPRGTFTLLVPDLPAAGSIVLFASRQGREGARGPAVEVARFDLRGEPEEFRR